MQTAPLARVLPSRNGSGTLLRDLFSLGSQIESNEFNARSFIPLFERIVSQASDLEISNALFALVTRPKSTPPTVFDKLPLDTPLKSTSSSQQANEQTHDDIDLRILQEINGCVYKDTGSFYEKYFEGKGWSNAAELIARDADPQVIDGRWTACPPVPSQSAFLSWFWEFQSRFLRGGRGTFSASPDLPLGGSDCKRKPDLFLILSGNFEDNERYNWAGVRVIGELKQSEDPGKRNKEFLVFCGHAREVFASQPTRRFLHGFFIRGSMMELWAFDRSGSYGSEKFDIHKDPRRFIKVMAGYSMMSDEELGINTYIKQDEIGKHIVFKGDDETEEEKLYLDDKPIAFQRAIICRGTTCYRAKRRHSKSWEFVVKFSWRSDKRRAEGELLKLAKERKVWGVAQLFGHRDLESIADLRRGLQFGKPQTFRAAMKNSINQSLSVTSNSFLNGLGINPLSSSSSGRKRKRQEETPATAQAKRSRSESSRRRSDITNLATAQEEHGTEGASKYSIELPTANSLICPEVRDNGSFDNRIFSCLVISPPGRAINEFKSVEEFLEACRDFVKAHRSLYEDGNILHRDISENNVVITDTESEGDPVGMLIDLDLAKELDGGPSGARHRTGTMEFMAIEVLKGRAHTYRHDLESFFHVFLWVTIRGRDKTLPEASQLRDWYKGTYIQIAKAKKSNMDKDEFEEIIAEFPAEFGSLKGLAEELRGILFPIRDGALFTGTYRDPDKLYRPMIEAFEKAIAGYGGVGSG